MHYYIAGPMRGYDQCNFPAFDRARDHIIGMGHVVTSPADLDRQIGFDPTAGKGDLDSFYFDAALSRDVNAILSVDASRSCTGRRWRRSRCRRTWRRCGAM
jgi:hypothetical protein